MVATGAKGEDRRLYQTDASGILDEEPLDDVGTTLYCRCASILDASDAAIGKIHCPVAKP